jgi:hypothetical protein
MLGLRREDEDVNRREYFLALEQVILYATRLRGGRGGGEGGGGTWSV